MTNLLERRSSSVSRTTLIAAYRWHRPLMALAASCGALLVVCLAGYAFDDRQVAGVSTWNKPTLFAISIAVYAVTLAWLISLMPKRRRLGQVLGTITAVMLLGELVAIVLQAGRAVGSHFNYTTTFDTAVYQVMAVLVAMLWLANLVLVGWLLTQRLADRTLLRALRFGMLIAVVGMALAFLMTLPSAAQSAALDEGRTLSTIGAHSVGVADGGPGLPVLGWSTTGGDLRIPHFVGLHGLQFMIVVALGLGALARRRGLTTRVQLRLVTTAAAAYGGVLAVVTWQALRGQSIVRPDAATLGAFAAVATATALAIGLIARRGLEPAEPACSTR